MTQWQPQRNESACQTAPTGAVKPPSHPCFGKLLQGGQVPPRGCARPWGTHSHGAWAHLADACTLTTGGYVQSLVGIRQRRAGSWAARQPALTPLPNKGVIRHPKTHLLWKQRRHLPACTGQCTAGPCKQVSRTLHGNQLWLAADSSIHNPATHMLRKILFASVFTTWSITLTGHK